MELFYSIIIGYLLGSIPTAFIILKYNKKIDIRNEGSGNVGTLNTYRVTKSKFTTFAVLIIDFLKGLLSVIIVMNLFGNKFNLQMFTLIMAVLGHCFSPWLKFKGGRGLATAAGGLMIIAPIIPMIWISIWIITYALRKNIYTANIFATLFILVVSILIPNYLNSFSNSHANESFIFGICVSFIMLIIFVKHWLPLKIQIQNYNKDRMK